MLTQKCKLALLSQHFAQKLRVAFEPTGESNGPALVPQTVHLCMHRCTVCGTNAGPLLSPVGSNATRNFCAKCWLKSASLHFWVSTLHKSATYPDLRPLRGLRSGIGSIQLLKCRPERPALKDKIKRPRGLVYIWKCWLKSANLHFSVSTFCTRCYLFRSQTPKGSEILNR